MNRGLDLAVAIACALATTPVVLLAPFAEPARIGLGLVFVLFMPGYVLVAALYPRNDDLDLVERVALSLGLSIAVVPLIGLSLNYSPWGIRLNPILAFVTLFIVLAAAVAVCRRLTLPSDEAMGIPMSLTLPKWPRVMCPVEAGGGRKHEFADAIPPAELEEVQGTGNVGFKISPGILHRLAHSGTSGQVKDRRPWGFSLCLVSLFGGLLKEALQRFLIGYIEVMKLEAFTAFQL